MNGWHYYEAKDGGMHFGIYQRKNREWAVYSAENRLDLMTGKHTFEDCYETLREAKEHVEARIEALDRNWPADHGQFGVGA